MQSRFSQSVVSFLTAVFIVSTIGIGNIYAATLRDEAESYRVNGYEAQEKGDIDSALSWYQKSASLDIDYAAPHNDLGILFEAKGWLDRAAVEYQKALAIDPNYEEAHTNSALLYERKGELEKAAFHWMRRYKLGSPKDPWTIEAKERLEKLGLLGQAEEEKTAIQEPEPIAKPAIDKGKEQEPVKGWTRIPRSEKKTKESSEPKQKKTQPQLETKQRGSLLNKTSKKPAKHSGAASEAALDKELQASLKLAEDRLKKERTGKDLSGQKTSNPGARTYYSKAHDYFNKGEYSRALDTIRNAKTYYPQDTDLLKMEESVKHKMKEEKIEDHYNAGIMHYRQNNYAGAKKEFEAILSILPE